MNRRHCRLSKHIARALILSLILLFVQTAGAQPGALRRCEWVGPPTETNRHYTHWVITDVGTLWDTWERVCTITETGPTIWFTVIWLRQCTVSAGFKIDKDGFGGEGGAAYTWTEQLVGAPAESTRTASRQIRQSKCEWTLTIPQNVSEIFSVTRYTHESICNSWVGATVTFDGDEVAFDECIDLNSAGVGPHLYLVSRTDGVNTDSLRFDIDVRPSYSLQYVASGETVNPSTIVRFFNDSPDSIDVDFSTSQLMLGLTAELLNNQQVVPPNSTVDVQVDFFTDDGYVVAEGQTPRAMLCARFGSPPGEILDSLVVYATDGVGPLIMEGNDSSSQAQDAFPTEIHPDITPGTGEHFRPTTDRFGTTAFSSGTDLGLSGSANLITGDSITINVVDVRGAGGISSVVWYGAIVSGPHAGKAPPPLAVGANGLFAVSPDSVRGSSGQVVSGGWSIDLDDHYFRGGDVVRYFWLAQDAFGAATSLPSGLTSVPGSLAEAEELTGGLFEVSFLPTIDWDPAYLSRIAADPSGKLAPTAQELANSSQANCILYYQLVNPRRRTGDANRTSFMYTLDVLGYRGHYDVYDHQGLDKTNNHLGGRATVEQAQGYSMIVVDTGLRDSDAPILPDGSNLDTEKIDQAGWFRNWLAQAPVSEAGIATLWIQGANAVEAKPTNPLYTTDMGAAFVAGDLQDRSVEAQGVTTFSNGNTANFIGNDFDLNFSSTGNYDGLDASGTGMVTHRYSPPQTGDGAIVMNTSMADSWNTIVQSHSWSDITGPPESPQPQELLLTKVLNGVLPPGCLQSPNPTDVPDLGQNQIENLPKRTVLYQNVPNPFNPTTTIHFDLARDTHVDLHIYNVSGRLVRTLVNGPLERRRHLIVWDGVDNSGVPVSTGIYFYRLETADFRDARRMIVLR